MHIPQSNRSHLFYATDEKIEKENYCATLADSW